MTPEWVARPESVSEVAEILVNASSNVTSVTPAGGQTSTTGASITDSGILLSTRGLNRILDLDAAKRTMRVESGVLLGDLKRAAASEGLLFPPDPTSEDESTIGGAIACNASGARSLKYGATRPHIAMLRVALASGEIVELRRSGLEKNTVGYALAHEPLDWFIGSEGTLGVVLEAELSLIPLPSAVIGIAFPFPSEEDALRFVIAARLDESIDARCIEYFDNQAFGIARSVDDQPGWAPNASTMVYVEEESIEEESGPTARWLDFSEGIGVGEEARVFEGASQLRHARRMRHNVPATMIERSALYREAGGRRVSTDWAVPFERLPEAVTVARRLATKADIDQAVIYGHAGNGHPHQNFVGKDAAEVIAIEKVVEATLCAIIAMGGTVAAEHGIGKLKRKWVGLQMSSLQVSIMRAVKRELDPLGILAPGNLL